MPGTCLDTVQPVLSPRPLQDCAVVGASDLLRWYPMGQRVEATGSIWRVNHSPTRGFAELVGNRTDVRIMNHVWEDVLSGRLKAKKEFAGEGREFADYQRMCRDNVCVALSNSAHMLSFHANAFKALAVCHAQTPSTGMKVVAAALRSCQGQVSLFGFFPNCCGAQNMFPGMNYKYYHTKASRWVCCASGRENMHSEYGRYVRHPRLRVYNTPTRVGVPSMPACAVVGSAATKRRYGAQIDRAAVVYRVDHHPTRGHEVTVGSRTDVRSLGSETMADHSADLSECSGSTQCVFIRRHGNLGRYSNASIRRSQRPDLLLVPVEFTRYIVTFKSQFTTRPWMKIAVSSELATVLYATERCSRVHVFLVETDHSESCRRAKRPHAHLNNCDTKVGNGEYRAWRELVSRGVVVHAT